MITFTPSSDDVAFYQSRGWFVTPPVLCQQSVEDALFGANRLYAGERDWHLPLRGGYLDWRPQLGPGLRLNDYVSLQIEQIKALVHQAVLGRTAAALLGVDSVRLFHDQLVGKPPAAKDGPCVVGWHTDRAYWMTCSSQKLLTAWIPLQDCNVNCGPLTVFDRSHLSPPTAHTTATFNDQDLFALERRMDLKSAEKVRMCLRRGQISFHHADALHGSESNMTDEIRLALTVHVQAAENTWKPANGSQGKRAVHVNDALCRARADGTPDYGDPAICPLLWPPSP